MTRLNHIPIPANPIGRSTWGDKWESRCRAQDSAFDNLLKERKVVYEQK